MSSRNGMDGLSSNETPPKLIRYTWDEMASYVNPEIHGPKRKRTAESYTPNLALLRGPTMKDTMKDRHSTYFFIKDYTGFRDGDEWHAVLDYIEIVFSVDRKFARDKIWNRARLKKAIQTLTKYAKKSDLMTHAELELCDENDKDNSMTAVMTKSGLHTLLESLSPRNKECARMRDYAVDIMAQLLAEEANVGAKAASSAPMQQSCSRMQAPVDEALSSASTANAANNTWINDTESESDVTGFCTAE
jgi:hypothetical protein